MFIYIWVPCRTEHRIQPTRHLPIRKVYREGGRTTQRSGILSAFSFVREKRDDMMPSLAKKV